MYVDVSEGDYGESESDTDTEPDEPARSENSRRGRTRARATPARGSHRAGARGRGRVRARAPQRNDEAYGWVETDSDYEEPEPCDQTEGISIDGDGPMSEIDAFRLIFDMEFFRKLKVETNRYARQCGDRRWSMVSLDELHKFFAVIFHMSLVKKPRLRDYFSFDPVLHAVFPKAIGMARDRFLSILKYLHLNDNDGYVPRGQPNHDPLHKLRPFIDLLNQKFKELYTPSANLTIDEAMIPWRGRLHFKVYMKNKPNKYGVRLEVVADSTNGIVCHFEAYTGAAGGLSNAVDDLVLRLLAPFEGHNYRVFMDRRYSSPDLFTKLLEKKFYPVGTVMKNRRNLPKAFEKKLKTGEVMFRRKRQLLALKWKDKRDVYLLATTDKAEMVESEQEQEARGGHQTTKPAAVLRYNKGKTGVDRHDQLASYYPLYRKTVKWWKKVFFGLVTMAVVNVQKYRSIKNRTNSRLDIYLKNLSKQLASLANDDIPQTPAAALEPRRHIQGDHFPIRIPATDNKLHPTKRCVVCCRKRDADGKTIRRESSWKCLECDVTLCVGCFLPYHRPHTRRRYSLDHNTYTSTMFLFDLCIYIFAVII